MNNSGWAYVYRLSPDGTRFLLDQEIVSPVGNNSYFGSGVGIHDDAVVVGADGYRKSRVALLSSVLNMLLSIVLVRYFTITFLRTVVFIVPIFLHAYVSMLFCDVYCAACHGETGAGFIFHREQTGWQLNQSYPSPAGETGHFGYAVDISSTYSVIGAYGFGKGAVCVLKCVVLCDCDCEEE